jgi:hypothetical protein
MPESFVIEAVVGAPAVANDASSRLDKMLDDRNQIGRASLVDRNHERLTGLSLHSSEHPTAFDAVAFVVLAFTELTLVYLNRLATSADLWSLNRG